MSDPGAFTSARQSVEQARPEHQLSQDEAAIAEAATQADARRKPEKVRGLWTDAWYELRHKVLFWVALVLIVIFVTMAVWPSLFTSADPYRQNLQNIQATPDGNHWFGTDLIGRDVYARSIYSARVSILVGMVAAICVGLLGGLVGVLAGYFGGWLDALLSRIADIVFGLPFILGAIVVLSTFSDPTRSPDPTKMKVLVIASLVLLSWPQFFRVMRSSVIATKQADYVQAARALGAGHRRIITRHLLPNAVAPLIVMVTIAFGIFVGAEATLSFLGIGIRPPVISWGVMISDAQAYIDIAPHMLLGPGGFLSAAVLGFVMLGEAVREALDPKLR